MIGDFYKIINPYGINLNYNWYIDNEISPIVFEDTGFFMLANGLGGRYDEEKVYLEKISSEGLAIKDVKLELPYCYIGAIESIRAFIKENYEYYCIPAYSSLRLKKPNRSIWKEKLIKERFDFLLNLK